MSFLSVLKHLAWKTLYAPLQSSFLQAALSKWPRGAGERAAPCHMLLRRRVLVSFDTLKHAAAQCHQVWAGLDPSLEQERVC